MTKLWEIIESLMRSRFTGKLEITFFEGGVRSAERVVKEKIL